MEHPTFAPVPDETVPFGLVTFGKDGRMRAHPDFVAEINAPGTQWSESARKRINELNQPKEQPK
jgi:hypothetical protein